jgi:hypothetical protein
MNQYNLDSDAKPAVEQNKPYASPAWEEEEVLKKTTLTSRKKDSHHIMCGSPIPD